VAGAALAAFDRIGASHIPLGTGNTERLLTAIDLLRPQAAVLTPSYAAYLIEAAAERGLDLAGSSVERVLVAGEPGGGEPAFRAMLEAGWGARVTEAMGRATSARRCGASASSRTGCTSVRAASCTRS
jgi:phenylacetate-CoA ligase